MGGGLRHYWEVKGQKWFGLAPSHQHEDEGHPLPAPSSQDEPLMPSASLGNSGQMAVKPVGIRAGLWEGEAPGSAGYREEANHL